MLLHLKSLCAFKHIFPNENALHIKSLCTIKHISVEEHAPVQSGALSRSEWDAPTADPLLSPSSVLKHIVHPTSAPACTCAERRPHPVRVGRAYK